VPEFAPGIPSKETVHQLPTVEAPTRWRFGVHEHHAKKRGLHFDLRLGDPETGHAHSWAMKASWPEPGKSVYAIRQPTHTLKYIDFEGEIPSGYGAGKVHLRDREQVEVTKSDPGHVSFNVYRSSGPEEYSLHHLGGKVWRLSNKTLHRGAAPLPESKPDYKEVPVEKIPYDDPRYLFSAKIDDAHNLFYFPETGSQIRVVSYRPSKKSGTGFIEHTHKVRSLFGKKTPKGLGGTILRGGLYAMHPERKKATEAHILGGLLNSDVWKSREKQETEGSLVPVLYDVVKYKGRDVSKAPYAEKLRILRNVQTQVPGFELPKMALTPDSKRELVKLIKEKKLAHTEEGIVMWDVLEGKPPIKAKFRDDHDVHIRGFFPGEGKYKGKGVGGFVFSHTADGPIVGRVGTGLSDALRRDMHEHPGKYSGMVAVVEAQGKFDKGALRAPSFKQFHLDKNPQNRLDEVLR
jgi:hypothetical protein